MLIHGHEVIGHEIEYQNGCYSREKYWINGWHHDLNERVQFVTGWKGEPQTLITRDVIKPIHTFIVE